MRAGFLFLLAAQALSWAEIELPAAIVLTLVAFGIGLVGLSVSGESSDGEAAPGASRVALAVVLALGTTLRLAFLEALPPYLDGDATSYAAEALRFLEPEPPPLFATGPWGLTNVYFFALSLPQRLAERSVAAVRIVGAIGGVLGLVATWALARRAFGERTAVLAALALAVSPMHLTYSRNGMEFVHGTWVAPLAVLLVADGWRLRSRRRLALAGAVAAAGLYVTPAARLVPIVLAIEIAWLYAREPVRDLGRLAIATVAVAGGCLVLVAPMIPHYLAHPETFDARVRDVTVFTSDWLGEEIRRRGMLGVWARQIRDSLLAFHARPSILPGPQYFWQPFLLPHESALLTVGILVALARARRSTIAATLLVWLAAGVVFGGVLTVTTPKTTRYVILLPVVALLIALGLERLIGRAGEHGGRARRAALLLYASIGIVASFVHDAHTVRRHDRTGRVATTAGLRLARAGDPAPEIYFLATPAMDFRAGAALPYLAGASGIDLPEQLDCERFARRRTRERTVLLAPAERVSELRDLARRLRSAGHAPRLTIDHEPSGEVVVALLELRAETGDTGALCGTTLSAGAGTAAVARPLPHPRR